MFKFLRNLLNLQTDEEFCGVPRSKLWSKVRDGFIQRNPSCSVCGKTENLVAHHIVPFHLDKSKELDEDNLITLCEGDTVNCHLLFGHLMHFCSYNTDVIKNVQEWNRKINERPG